MSTLTTPTRNPSIKGPITRLSNDAGDASNGSETATASNDASAEIKVERSPIFRTVFKDDPSKPRTWQDWPFGEMPFAGDRRTLKTTTMREAILRSAARAFSRKGYHGTSMDDIAKELLMTKGALYYYFRDKEDILYACHDYSLSLVLENLAVVEASDESNERKLRDLIRAHVAVMLDALQGSAMALDFNALSPHLLENIVAKRDHFERGMRALIKEGMNEGTFRSGDEKLAAFMILGSINWITKWYREGGGYNGDQIAEAYAEYFINGLRHGAVQAISPVSSPKSVVRAKSLARAATLGASTAAKAKSATKGKVAAKAPKVKAAKFSAPKAKAAVATKKTVVKASPKAAAKTSKTKAKAKR